MISNKSNNCETPKGRGRPKKAKKLNFAKRKLNYDNLDANNAYDNLIKLDANNLYCNMKYLLFNLTFLI